MASGFRRDLYCGAKLFRGADGGNKNRIDSRSMCFGFVLRWPGCGTAEQLRIQLRFKRSWRLLAGIGPAIFRIILYRRGHQLAPASADHWYNRTLSFDRLGGRAASFRTGTRMRMQNVSVLENVSDRYRRLASLRCGSLKASAAPWTPRLVMPPSTVTVRPGTML